MNGTSTADNHGGRPAKRVNLALQGRGAHGVFTWEVLDRLIEDKVLAHAADELWDCRSCRATGRRAMVRVLVLPGRPHPLDDSQTCCGCAAFRPSKSCAWRCSSSPTG